MTKKVRIAIDFDGTIVDNRFPLIGPPAPRALYWLKLWSQDPRITLCLWTMRSNGERHGEVLAEAEEFLSHNNLHFPFINRAFSDLVWTTSPKLYAHIYIDDHSIGTPMIQPEGFRLPCVDWEIVGPLAQRRVDAIFDGWGQTFNPAPCDSHAL